MESTKEYLVQEMKIVSDTICDIQSQVLKYCYDGIHLVITTGGTGFGHRDVTVMHHQLS